MAGFGVKNTTRYGLFDLLCPHYCRGCGMIGEAFCECCKNDINVGWVNCCPNCKKNISLSRCSRCKMGFEKTFIVGWYDEAIGTLVREYKYNSVRILATTLANLLDDILPVFKDKIVLVPLPTISPHIRQRGFDHIGLLAKKLAKMRGWEMRKCLGRRKNSVQVGASSNMRKEQAKWAYELINEIKKEEVYLLIDDVWTTGASMREAAKILRNAGAKRVMIAVLAVNRSRN